MDILVVVFLSLFVNNGKRFEFVMSDIGEIDNVGDVDDDGDGGVLGQDWLWQSVYRFFKSDCDDVNGGGANCVDGDDKGDENDVLGAWTGEWSVDDDWFIVLVLLFDTVVWWLGGEGVVIVILCVGGVIGAVGKRKNRGNCV